jgi:alkanesulfonate monooxygenase SsuD/methylene tetrahydromethanopterin reductase-like flavin-dependent oxidoreductase (luciferase family)
MALTFGLALMNDFPPGTRPTDRIAALREQAAEASRCGIESVWVLQHYLGSMPTLQPLLLLSALADCTGDMRVGTNMYILPLRHPVAAAEEFATLDHLTGGRAVAGLGMGYRENEFEAFGISMKERVGRYTESVELMRALWTGERVTYSGKHFSLHDEKISLTPVQPGGPPVWVGAGAHQKGIERAARLGDAWIIPPHVTGDRLSAALATYLAEREKARPGEPAELVVRREILLDEDAELAQKLGEQARGALTQEYSRYNAPDQTADYAHLADADAALQKAREAYLFTDPQGAVAKLKALEEMGVTHVVLRMQWFDLPQERVLRSLELFREQVLPHFS